MSTTEWRDVGGFTGRSSGDPTARIPAAAPPRDSAVTERVGSAPLGVDHGTRNGRSDVLPREATERMTQTAGTAPVARVVRRRVTVRHLEPFSVLKLSVIFYFTVLLLVMLALTILWAALNNFGIVDIVLGALESVSLSVEVRADSIARAIFLLGLLGVVVMSGVNVFLCFLYNLVSDLIGGLRMTLAEEE